MNTTLRIAIQKSGRLQEDSLKLLKESGLQFSNGKDQLKTQVRNLPIELLFLRDDDIPQYVEDKVADAGIVGENVFVEKQKKNELVRRLDFAKCRLSIAIPRSESFTGISYLEGKNIATSFPVIVQQYLDKNKIKAGIHEISGSVEIAPGIGLADAICDIVSTGSTLLSNGLKEVDIVMQSEAILIATPELEVAKKVILDKLLFRMQAVQSAKNNKYILLNCPNEAIEKITSVIPGMKSPTIMPLSRAGWSSLHSVVDENDFWEKIDLLKSFGAEGILVIPIEKMIA
ncbi:MAG: ATP phosphoribosyltransferase [Cytophagales bacterium]|jgi:ATP phosphoribosyltransferase|nr:ATP phosphoribosyltransferase [Cytophagales bacterium]MCA6387890.1 ATP phosphoribosyltransferase [Cytophagales bacterium]MCA6390970.1 ATP phosphoribosyltransferase [Cytophagales bacterium]MCA6394899.1 ATP phosphoribosyltransferase [Cytophagales bacterium]MCA6398355.1 ATP phosphoribosyltransferase [Cytophagales bacterium]